MKWFREAASSPVTNRLSSSRIIALVAGLTLSFATLFLTVASFFRVELVTPLTAFGTTLGVLAGSNYVTNRITAPKTGSSSGSDEPRP